MTGVRFREVFGRDQGPCSAVLACLKAHEEELSTAQRDLLPVLEERRTDLHTWVKAVGEFRSANVRRVHRHVRAEAPSGREAPTVPMPKACIIIE